MNKQEIKETRNTLLDWVWDKYQPKDGFNPFHELFFKDNALTYQEVEDAVDAFVNKNVEVYGDVMCENNDMFCVRDIVLSKRGVDYTDLQCGLWIRYHIDNKPVGVVEYRASVKKEKKEDYDDIQQSNPEYVAAVGMRRYSNFEEYWLQQRDRITSGGWVDSVLDKIYNNKR